MPCLIVSYERAVQISLAENSGREPMHPADEFEAFNLVWVDLETGATSGPNFDFATGFGFLDVSPSGTQAFLQHDLGLPGETDYRLIDLCPGTFGTVINQGGFPIVNVNEQLFAEVWTRETLPVRDRRLVLLGIIGALGERDTFQIQVKAALKNGELTPAQVREVVITLANYAGYPRAAAQVVATEQTIAAVEKEKKGA